MAQQSISLKVKNTTLRSVLFAIKDQTGYGLVFTRAILKNTNPVSLSVRNQPLDAVLALCFKGQPVTYKIINGSIIVTRKETELPAGPNAPSVNRAVADTGSLSGQVYDAASGIALPGVTILDKLSGKGTVSDGEGHYLIRGIDPATAVLQFSSIGYESQEITTKGGSSLTVRLLPQAKGLDETVIVAYGSTTKRMNTGSITKVSSKEIETQPISNPILALQGRVPGLDISQVNGLPGSNINVMIRGRNSIQQGTDPLYIVNGVPFISDNLSQNNGLGLYANSPFNTINPNDIESIEVLKDADATAIYGSRGANGVIMITTKSGKSGKVSVDASFQSGWGKVAYNYKMMSTQQYLSMRREAFTNDGVTPTASSAPDLLRFDSTRDDNWTKALTGNTARTNDGNVRLTAGDNNTNIGLGFGYHRETTVFPGDFNDKRFTVDLSGTHRSKDGNFSVSFFVNYADDENQLPTSSLASNINAIPNTPPVIDENGKLIFISNGVFITNPYVKLFQHYRALSDRLSSGGTVGYSVLPNITLKADWGYNTTDYKERTETPIVSQNPAFNPTGNTSFASNQVTSWIIEPQLEYSGQLAHRGNLTVLFGATWQQSKQEGNHIDARGYTNDDFLDFVSPAVAQSIQATNSMSNYRYNAFFGRLNYNFDNKYVLNLTGRRDGSSRFGTNRQFANFGAVGAAWIFSKMQWLSDNLNFLSFGKLRGSYGVTGNDQIGDYQYLDTWQVTPYAYEGQNAMIPSKLYNSDFSWEKNTKLDLALELGFLKDRVNFSLDWYRNMSSNQLIYYRLPTQTGFNSILMNFPGKVENTGWEFVINTVNIKKHLLSWNSSVNLTIPRNKLVAFPGLEQSSDADNYVIGKPLGVQKGFHYLGVDPNTGVYTFEDKDKNGILNSDDYRVIGTVQRNWYGGILNSVSYRGFTFDFFFQLVNQIGRSAVYTSALIGKSGNVLALYGDHWQKQGDKTPFQKYSQQTGGPAYVAAGNISFSDAGLTDASFVRLKNVSISYLLPPRVIQRLKMQRCRIFLQAQNLLTWTNYIGGDPEGQNRLQLPPLRTIAAGIQVTF